MSAPGVDAAIDPGVDLPGVYDAYLAGYLGAGHGAAAARGEPGTLAAALGRRDAALGFGMRSVEQVRRWARCCAAYVVEHQRCSRGDRAAPPGEPAPPEEADAAVTLVRLIARQDAATRNVRSPVELAELLRRVGEHA